MFCFEFRYHPTSITNEDSNDDEMRLTYSNENTLGFCNRYCMVHHFFFFAAFLDPRVKNRLPTMLPPLQYEKLLSDFETALIADATKRAESNANNVIESDMTMQVESISPEAQRMSSMFRGIQTLAPTRGNNTSNEPSDKALIEEECHEEMRKFKRVTIDLLLYDKFGKPTNP